MSAQSYYTDLFKRKTEDRFYVYVHYKVSDGKPFYVGKGTAQRAWNKSTRNEYWKRVVAKHGLRVEIVFDHLTEEESFQVEKDTILEFKYFGYQLTNFTNGGEGSSGFKFSDEQKEKISSAHKGRKLSDEHRNMLSESLKYSFRDKNTYTFVSKTGEIFNGTKAEFARMSNLESYVIARISTVGNTRQWAIVKDGESPEQTITRAFNKKKGANAPTSTKDVYTFVNKDSEEVFVGTRMELVEKYNVDRVSLSQVFNKANSSTNTKGWGVLGENETIEDCLFRLKNARRLSKTKLRNT